MLRLGEVELHVSRPRFGVVIEGAADGDPAYLDGLFADPIGREAFFALVDAEGLVVARNLTIDPTPYRPVRGKRSRGRLSQGEFFHHDGCSTPVRPRVVEIRCPQQPCVRSMGTSVAAFPAVVHTMLEVLQGLLERVAELEEVGAALRAQEAGVLDWDGLQGELNRIVRQLDAETARAFFAEVDGAALCFAEPWTLGESRFIANENPTKTAQHRRACRTPWVAGVPNGMLIKRWPAEELESGTVAITCADRAD